MAEHDEPSKGGAARDGDAGPDHGPADGRSEILDRLLLTLAGVGPDRTRVDPGAPSTGAEGDPQGLSALLGQLVAPSSVGESGAEDPAALSKVLASVIATPEGRSALLAELARQHRAGAADGATVLRPLVTALAAAQGRSELQAGLAGGAGPVRAPAANMPPPSAARSPAVSLPIVPGMTVGRFAMVREIGRGGFGVVFEAQDKELGRAVAFKTLRPGVRTRQLAAMLRQEAESAARLQHENIVAIFDHGVGPCGPYLVLELLRGETLATRLARGPMPTTEAVHVGAQVARAIAHAHGAGLLHRDLKPGNVFLTDSGGVKVMDLGLASFLGEPTGPSGTPAYMAPEQWKGEPQDERTDVFALGVTLFEMLAGRRPYEVRADRSTVLDPGPAPRLEAPDVPGRLRRLVERCIAKEPAGRPTSARAVLEELLVVERDLGRRRWSRRTRLLVAAGAVAVVVAAAGVAWWRATAPPDQRVPLAVVDIENRTGETEMEGLSSLLITSLQESQVLDVLPRSRMRDVLRLAGKDVKDHIDEALGRELGALAGVRALLVGRIHRFGDAFALEIQAIDPVTDRPLFAVKEQGRGRESIPEILDRVSERVRKSMKERSTTIQQHSVRLAQAVTPDMDAWQAYFRGLECSERFVLAGSYGDCLADFQKAVSIDPGFALAHFQIAYLYYWQGLPRAKQRAALEPALRDQSRIPPKDRLRIRGWAAYLDGKDAEAAALLAEAAREAPDDKFIWYLAGEMPFHRDELGPSVPLFQHAHRLDPTWLLPTQHLALALGALERRDDLAAMVKGLEALGPKPGALVGLCYALLWADRARAHDACDRAIAAGAGLVGQEFLAIELLNGGGRPELDALLARMGGKQEELGFAWYMTSLLAGEEGRWQEVAARVARMGDPEDSWFHGIAAELLVGAGDRAAAWKHALRALEIDRASVTNLAVHFAWMGDLAHAAEFLPYLPPGSPRVESYRALVRWRQGDAAGAVEPLRKAVAASPISIDPATPHPVFLLGVVLHDAGNHREAASALRRFVAMPLHAPTWQRSVALYYLARSLEAAGDLASAGQVAAQLAAAWRDASPEQPLLAEARALAARLTAR